MALISNYDVYFASEIYKKMVTARVKVSEILALYKLTRLKHKLFFVLRNHCIFKHCI